MSDTSPFKSFSTANTSGSSESASFLESNSLIAKFSFLLLVIFGFVILLNIGISVVARFLQPDESPRLIDGMVDAKQSIVFHQDPSHNDAVTIYRSVNANKGIEFTWSVWIYIDDLKYLQGQYRHVFHKGNSNLSPEGLNFPNNAPGLYIAPNTNSLIVIMNTFRSINEEVIIPDIPLNKWVNVIIRVQNETMDVYINGTITRSIKLAGVPKQNYGDVFVAMNGGFSGNISNLWYYNYALGTREIQNILYGGPNTTLLNSSSNINAKNPNYLSLRWYFAGSGDMFNPVRPAY
jgi:hypothetical protein